MTNPVSAVVLMHGHAGRSNAPFILPDEQRVAVLMSARDALR